MEDSVVSTPPELILKFWPVTITAKGTKAIDAVQRPLAVLVYARAATAVILGLGTLWAGHELLPWALKLVRFL